MKFRVRLFHLGSKAADGSTISREVLTEYLNSDNYKKIINNRTSFGGITHVDRSCGIKNIGPDDGPLNSGNYAFYITRIFIDGDDAFADAETLDPEDFSGHQKDIINSVIGYLKAGSKLGISVVISGEWGMREECRKIDNILGFDITNNPSFKDAEVIKVFSLTELTGGTLELKSFSEVKLLDEDYELNDVAPTALLDDTEFMKEISTKTDLPKEELKVLCDNELKKRYFTYDVNLIDRVLITRKPIFNQSYLLLSGYSKYYSSHRSLVKANPMKFMWMLMSDFSSIIHNGLKKLASNVNPAAVLGLKGYSEELETALDEFTKTHFYNSRMMDRNGFLVKNQWIKEMDATRKLYNTVIKYVTQGELSLSDSDKIILI